MSRALAPLLALLLAGCQSGQSAVVAPLRYEPSALAPEEPFRSQEPDSSPVPLSIALPWHTATLPNGVRVALLERHELPMVLLDLVIDRGAVDLPPRTDGYPLLNNLLQAGTEAHTASGLRDAWARLGATHGAGVGPDGSEIWAKVVASDFDPALSLVAETATRPRLTQLVDVLHDASSDTFRGPQNRGAVMVSSTRALLFGQDHAYGPHSPHPNDLAGAASVYAQIFQPAHATLVVVGDVTPEAATASAARLLGSWTPRAPAPLPLVTTPPPEVPGPRVVHVEWKDEAETLVSIVARGPGTASEDLPALEILARSFGGLSSRMRGDLREERGAAYLFGAEVTRYRTASFLSVHAALAGDRAVPALRAMLDTISLVAQNGLSEPELTRARTSVLAGFRTQVSASRSLASVAGGALSSGLPLEEVERYAARLQAVTLDDIRRVAAKYLAPGALRLVVLGSPRLRPALEQLGLGPVERRNQYGFRADY